MVNIIRIGTIDGRLRGKIESGGWMTLRNAKSDKNFVNMSRKEMNLDMAVYLLDQIEPDMDNWMNLIKEHKTKR